MTRISIISLAALLLMPFAQAGARARNYKGEITAVPMRLEQIGDSLYVDMDIRLSNMRVKRDLSIDLTPELASPVWERSLPVISVKGRSSYKAYKRSLAMERKAMKEAADTIKHTVVKGFRKVNTTVKFHYATLYESWMADAYLSLKREDVGCCKSNEMNVARLVGSVKLEPRVPEPVVEMIPQLAFVTPEAEEVKSREIQAECRLDFFVNKTNIDSSYRNNPQELAKIRDIIDGLKEDPAVSIVGLEIIGYASPEGSLANNKRLSEGRAMALRNYLAGQYDFPLSTYKVTFGGENWDGLVKALENNPMEYAADVLAVIGNTEPDQSRKNRLQALHGGVPYGYMLKYIYPGLRTAICKIDYHIRGFDARDAAAVFKTRPQNLSLNEFYMAANTMEEGSPEFVEVFETAVRMYPDDEIANLNAAVAAIRNGNTQRAQNYLEKIDAKRNLPEYNNAMGALSLAAGDRDAARLYFRLAAEGGLDAAGRNLEIMSGK